MNLQQSLDLLQGFSAKNLGLGADENSQVSQTLQQQKSASFPAELTLYIDRFCPAKALSFAGVGNPVELRGKHQLSWQLPGFNLDPATGQVISGWNESWFLIASEGGEPIIVDLAEDEVLSKVYSAMQGESGWEFAPIADSIGQFLLCAAALEHAMNFPGVDQPLDDDFNLADDPASWLFPFLKQHAAQYYDEWASVFENY